MGLKEFVTTAILDIVEGVEQANMFDYRVRLIELGNEQQMIFDVAVTVEDGSSLNGQGRRKGGIFVVAAGTGRPASAAAESSGVTRIRFGVRVDRSTPEQVPHKTELLKALRTLPRLRR